MIVTLDDGDDEGLALLIPDIHETTLLVQRVTNIDKLYNSTDDVQMVDQPLSKSIEERYLEIMKKLQFGKFTLHFRSVAKKHNRHCNTRSRLLHEIA